VKRESEVGPVREERGALGIEPGIDDELRDLVLKAQHANGARGTNRYPRVDSVPPFGTAILEIRTADDDGSVFLVKRRESQRLEFVLAELAWDDGATARHRGIIAKFAMGLGKLPWSER
jgi:hypothetical protein